MAIVKVLGMETEYGIIIRGGGDPNPIAASSALINAYVAELARRKVEWDFEDETPGQDARGFAREGSMPPRWRPTWSTPCSPTAPATTSTTPTPSTPTPSAPTPSTPSATTRRGGDPGPVDGRRRPGRCRRARASWCSRTTPTARATPTAPTRTT